jgi:hypothetical protein
MRRRDGYDSARIRAVENLAPAHDAEKRQALGTIGLHLRGLR